jgi:hypothetical protein
LHVPRQMLRQFSIGIAKTRGNFHILSIEMTKVFNHHTSESRLGAPLASACLIHDNI